MAAVPAIDAMSGATIAEPTLRPARAFARWAARDLPSLAEVLAGHVERRCASPEGAEAASKSVHASRARGKQPEGLHSLPHLLALERDVVRMHLGARLARDDECAAEQATQAAGAFSTAGMGLPPRGAGASTSTAPSMLVGDEWLWVLSLALDLCGARPQQPSGQAAGGWSCPFSTQQHGRSLHTLRDRVAGYGEGGDHGPRRGQLLVCSDTRGYLFGAWADKGFGPVLVVNFSGGDGCGLVRLRPSLLVCRARRRLARSAEQRAANARARTSDEAAGSVQLRAASAAFARRRGEPPAKTVATLDCAFCYCNNKRGQRRGLGMGGTLERPRLWLSPSSKEEAQPARATRSVRRARLELGV